MKKIFLLLFFLPLLCSGQMDTITLYYEIGSHNAAKGELEKIVITPEWGKVSVISYTDYLGSVNFNQELSLRRAQAARSRLIQRGLSSDQLGNVEGRGITGETLTTKEGIQENRRTDIIIWQNEPELVEESSQEEKVQHGEGDLNEEINALEVGSKLVLEKLSFIPGRHYLQENSIPTLDSLVQVLTDNLNLKIAIEGHICCEANLPDGYDQDTQTQNLSFERAKYIYEQLIFRGIDENRLSYAGFGRSNPIYPNELTTEEQQANRRVEIKIIEK